MDVSRCSKGYLAARLVDKVLMTVPGGKEAHIISTHFSTHVLESRKKNIYLRLL